jgi:hypothetical protein
MIYFLSFLIDETKFNWFSYERKICKSFYPDRLFRPPDTARSCRKTPEIAATRKQYSGRKSSELAGTGRCRARLFDMGMTANICQVSNNSG